MAGAGLEASQRSQQGNHRRAEWRQITALFSDLVGSVALSRRLDAEGLLRVLDQYQACCDEVISAHGGYLARYMGDGVLAYFGFPSANEDDAANAVRAGLALIRAVSALDGGPGSHLRARVGIATGRVVVANLKSRGGLREQEIVGDTPNLAARLQSMARPGTVVVSDATRRLTRGLFAYRDLGLRRLKGFEEPVQIWQGIESRSVESRFLIRVQDGATPFVGRQHELETILQCWQRARAGRGQVVIVIGEPGIGKSRLAEMTQRALAGTPHAALKWFCSPEQSDTALYPVIARLERMASIARSDRPEIRLAKLRRRLSEIGPLTERELEVFAALLSIPLGRPSEFDALTPQKRKEVTQATLLAHIHRAARSTPLLMIVEDAHWIDATSLDLLDATIRQAPDLPCLVIVTARPEFAQRWAELPFVTTLGLGSLDARSAEAICSHVAADSLMSDMVQQILERSDGNPLFIEELTKAVVERAAPGARSPEAGSGEWAAAIPLSLHDSLVARLDRLGPAREIANIGATIGRVFHHDLLAAVADRPAGELRSALRELMRSGLVERLGPSGASGYIFRHALIRDAAYESLLRSERQILHGRIASALRHQLGGLPEPAPELVAHHLSRSGAWTEAIPYWEMAGERSAARGTHVEAVQYFRACLEALPKLPPGRARTQQELMLSHRLALSLASSKSYAADEVRKLRTHARALCDQLGNIEEIYWVLRGLCTYHIVSSELQTAEELAVRCKRIGELSGRPEYMIEAHNALGYVYAFRGEYEPGSYHLERAAQLYDEHAGSGLAFQTEQDPRMASLSLLAFVLCAKGETVKAARCSREALDHARSLGRPFDLAYALSFAEKYALLAGEYEYARQLAEEAIELCERYGFGVWLIANRMHLGAALGYLGQYETAIAILAPALEAWIKARCRTNTSFHLGQLAIHYASAGRLDEALVTVDTAIAHARDHQDGFYVSALHRHRAEMLMRVPGFDRRAVIAELRKAIAVARQQGAWKFEVEAATILEARFGEGAGAPSFTRSGSPVLSPQ